jgi:hypothetical protein
VASRAEDCREGGGKFGRAARADVAAPGSFHRAAIVIAQAKICRALAVAARKRQRLNHGPSVHVFPQRISTLITPALDRAVRRAELLAGISRRVMDRAGEAGKERA